MGRKVIDRTGEEGYNSFGSKIVIKEYRKRRDIDVYFPEYDWTAKHVQYNNFKKELLNVLMNLEFMEWVIWAKVNILPQKMVKKQINMIYGVVCCEDAMILNSMKNILHIKIVKQKNIY